MRLRKKCFLSAAFPQRLEAAFDSAVVTARVELVPFPCVQIPEFSEKTPSDVEGRPLGLKPGQIPDGLRGPEKPLFHGDGRIREFFRNL